MTADQLYPIAIRRSFAMLFCFVSFTASAQGGPGGGFNRNPTPGIAWTSDFQFEQEGTGDVLATLRLSDNEPWDHTNVLDFSFTPAGDAIFGLGVGTFSQPFTNTFNGTVGTDPQGRLDAESTLILFETDLIDFLDGAEPDTFSLNFIPFGPDTVFLTIDDSSTEIAASGYWNPIPEPTSFALLSLGALVLTRRCRNGLLSTATQNEGRVCS